MEELKDLSARLGIALKIEKEISVPYRETEEKTHQLLRELLNIYEKNAYVYLDLTNGTKLKSIELFSSLFFAETCRSCSIKNASYGKYAFDDAEVGELYDVTRLYHMLRFLEISIQMDKASFTDLVEQMLEG